MEKKIGILAFVPDEWESKYQTRHYIVDGLSKYYKILWLMPPSYLMDYIDEPKKKINKNTGLRNIKNNLWSYGTKMPIDYKKNYNKKSIFSKIFKYYRKLWCYLYVVKIRRIITKLKFDKVVIYIWRPEYYWVIEKINAALVCYHIDDEYSFNPDKDAEMSFEELYLLKRSDIVFIHSNTLMKKKGGINKNTFSVPNGVDYKYYRSVIDNGYDIPYDIDKIPHPRIGYMGYIKKHLDLNLVFEIAERNEKWSIVFIGPIREEHSEIEVIIKKLMGLRNVYFLGGKEVAELPKYINELDVCIMPYKITNYTKYIYPLKMHEYFSCGKPVVSTKIDNIIEFSEIINIAEGTDQWVETIKNILNNDDMDKRKMAIDIAMNNSWDDRVDKIKRLIDENFDI